MKKITTLISAIAFTVLASAQITLPYLEDFEGATADTLLVTTSPVPGIPTLDYRNGGTFGRLRTNTGVVGAGSKSLVMDVSTNSNYDSNFATLTLDMSNYNVATDFVTVSFYIGNGGDENHAQDKVWVRGNSTSGTPWIELYNWELNVANGSIVYVSTLDVSNALQSNSQNFSTTFQIKFGQYDNFLYGTDGLMVDEVLFQRITCPAPDSLSVSNITSNSVDLSWVVNSGATTFEVVYGTSGFAFPSGGTSVITTSNPYTVTGLTGNSTYEFYVRDICGAADSSVWLGPISATTPCSPIMAPWVESFDTNVTPACWSQSATTGGPWQFGQFGNTGAGYTSATVNEHTNNGGFYTYMDFSGTDYDVELVTPVVDMSNVGSPAFSFWLYSGWDTATYTLTDTNYLLLDYWDGSNWMRLDSVEQWDTTWVRHKYDMTGRTYGSNLMRVRFITSQTGNGSDFYNDLLIDDVNLGEYYTCGAGGLTATTISTTGIQVTWTENGTANSWDIEYGASGFTSGTGTVVNTTTNPTIISGLNPGTAYDFYIVGNCSGMDTTTVSGPATATTDGSSSTGLSEYLSGMAKVYPNPARGVVNVELQEFDENTTIEIITLRGEIIRTVNVTSNVVTMDISEMSNGMYTLRVQSSNGIGMQKLIIE